MAGEGPPSTAGCGSLATAVCDIETPPTIRGWRDCARQDGGRNASLLPAACNSRLLVLFRPIPKADICQRRSRMSGREDLHLPAGGSSKQRLVAGCQRHSPANSELEVSRVIEAQVFLPSQAACRAPGVIVGFLVALDCEAAEPRQRPLDIGRIATPAPFGVVQHIGDLQPPEGRDDRPSAITRRIAACAASVRSSSNSHAMVIDASRTSVTSGDRLPAAPGSKCRRGNGAGCTEEARRFPSIQHRRF